MQRLDRKPRKGWSRSDSEKNLFDELNKRQMVDLETCRRVWEEDRDPLAVCSAVSLCRDIPEWLVDAVLVMLTDGVAKYQPAIIKDLWEQRTRDANDRVRAQASVAARVQFPELGLTAEKSRLVGELLTHEKYNDPEFATVGASSMKKAYRTVAKGLTARSRYYLGTRGISDRIDQAWLAVIERWKVGLARSGRK